MWQSSVNNSDNTDFLKTTVTMQLQSTLQIDVSPNIMRLHTAVFYIYVCYDWNEST